MPNTNISIGRVAAVLIALSLAGCVSAISGLLSKPAALTPAEYSTLQDAAECGRVLPLTAYATLDGEIASSDCPYKGATNGSSGLDVPADYFALKVGREMSGETFRVSAGSDAFDARIVVFDKHYNAIAYDDDSGRGFDATLNVRLQEGVYLVAVTPTRPGETGAYRFGVMVASTQPLRSYGGLRGR